jgi:deoxycytidylate deaminase
MLINAGIVRVVYEEDYPDDGSLGFLKLAEIEVLKMKCPR